MDTLTGAGPNGQELVRRSSGEQAALYVRRLIFEGQLTPGSRVQQDDIARTLGISRIPLREALVALERDGWVTLEMHRGAFVNVLDERAVRDHYELFGIVYGYTIRQALARSGPQLVEQLAPLERAIRSAGDPLATGELLLQFHATMIDAAQSNRIKIVLRNMSTIVPGDDYFRLVPGAVGVERRALPAIMRAVRKGDGEQAAAEYQRMMRGLADEVVGVLRENGMFASASGRT